MNEMTRTYCETFIENRNMAKKVFPMENGMSHLACAAIYASEGKHATVEELKNAKKVLKKEVGAFSNFRGTARPAIISLLATSENAEEVFANALLIYQQLKKTLHGSEYMAYAAIVVARTVKPEQYNNIICRTEQIYNGLKAEHPFLTSREDDAMCVLLALSEKPVEALLAEAESCYQMLKGKIGSKNATWSLACVLTLCDGIAEGKCERTIALYKKLHEMGCKYGKDYELPTLGLLAAGTGNIDEIASDITEIDQWLASRKGFGVWSGVGKKHRLMYAGLLAQGNQSGTDSLQMAAVSGTISAMIAVQAATCAAIAASGAAAASASS